MEKYDLFQKVLNNGLQDMVFVMRVCENDFIYEFFNDTAKRKTGLTENDIGSSLSKVLSPTVASLLYQKYTQVVKTNDSITYQDSFHSTANTEIYSETQLTPLFNKRGICTHIVALTKDITKLSHTEKKAAESARRFNKSNERYKSLFEHNSDAIFALDLNGRIVNENSEFKKIIGYDAEDLHTHVVSLITPKRRKEAKLCFLKAVKGDSQTFETYIRNRQKSGVYLQVKMTPIVLKEGIEGVYVSAKDITSNKKLEFALKESEERFRLIAENSKDLINLLDREGTIIYASPSYAKTLDIDSKDYIGAPFLHFMNDEEREKFSIVFKASIDNRNSTYFELPLLHQTNGWMWLEIHCSPVFNEKNKFVHMVAVTRNITERKEHEDRLKQFAFHDSLTGLPNRRLFQEKLLQAITRFQQHNQQFAVMMLDLDNLKKINDELGHDIGDRIIIEFSTRVKKSIRDMDTAARLGGDEFIVLLPDISSKDKAWEVAQRMQVELNNSWCIEHHKIKATVSIGISVADAESVAANTIVKHADEALYKAKSEGKNTIRLA
ncbi:diguanylate cyclase domain-containing protein [Virgibacillus flavescens]|uniref:diguanylate cyclase domain-containing protein n=1 Tax=Virgibacillus flavescens TaxID=1611422 RepID=UPI003D344441